MSLLIAGAVLLQAVGSSALAADTSPTRQRVDLIELNHFVDDQGREVFQQLIFYDWSPSQQRFLVRAWRLVKRPSQLPRRRWNPYRVECSWHDNGRLRQVVSSSMRETWSQQDPERVNRKLLPEDERVPLFR